MKVVLSPWMRLLAPLSFAYGAAASWRRRRLALRARSLEVPVISVGNITVGGTGKTPVVELAASMLLDRGFHPGVLSRGYGKPRGGGFNDEYLVLEQNLPGLIHVQHADRVRAGLEAIRRGADVLVLDDGFQHVRLKRDLDIVLIDATNPFGFGRVLPAGLLREPLEALGEADLLLLTRCRLASPHKVSILRHYLGSRFSWIPQAEVDFLPVAWRDPADPARVFPLESLRDRRVAAFCGIGNPEGFRRELELLGLRIESWTTFRDHHAYTAADLRRLDRLARNLGVDGVVMTQKDAVKIRGRMGDASPPWRFLQSRPELSRGRELFETLLRESVSR